MDKKIPDTQSQQDTSKPRKQINNTCSSDQRKRLLEALRNAPLSTIQIRHKLDIFHPAARIQELRHDYGFNIVTHWEEQETPEGYMHRVVMYVLLAGKYQKVSK